MDGMSLYLDFDGVLHPDAVFIERGKPVELRAPGKLMMHAQLLEEILDEHPDIEIILSTSWVRFLGYSRTLRKLPTGVRNRVAGSTWHSSYRSSSAVPYSRTGDPFDHMTRFDQISWHVQRHQVMSWIALDDLHSGTEAWPEEHQDRLVLCGESGLADRSVQIELGNKLTQMQCIGRLTEDDKR